LDVLHLIDRLEELVAEARRMPIGQGVVVDRRRILELVDQMRSAVPWEVKQAQEIVAEKEALLEEARREGEGIVARAEMDAQAKLDDTEIVKVARGKLHHVFWQLCSQCENWRLTEEECRELARINVRPT